jgi:hypothetical protein
MVYLSQALGEHDNILMSLTNNIKLMTSVHGEGGELLFATKSLLEEIDVSSLQDAYSRHQKFPQIIEQGDVGNTLHDGAEVPATSQLRVRGKSDEVKVWQMTIQKSPGSVSFVSWSRAQAQ